MTFAQSGGCVERGNDGYWEHPRHPEDFHLVNGRECLENR
jgi:hypothetical protein